MLAGSKRPLLTAALLLGGLFAACAETPTDPIDDTPPPPPPPPADTVVPAGDRVLAISISDRADGDFNTAYGQAVAAGMQATSLSLGWNDQEIAPGAYQPAIDFLQIANDYYGPRGTRLLLSLNPIDTNNSRLPTHLEGRRWNDADVVTAYKALLDWALPKAQGLDLVSLAIGNEVDATLASVEAWDEYRDFFIQVGAHARSLRPGLRVGVKVTKDGLTGPFAAQAAALVESSDLVLTTYYPLGPGFQIEAPPSVGPVFDDLVSRFPTKPILFAEIGSPSTSMCGASEALQAEFVRAAFAAWDRHADHIELLDFVWMHDISQGALDTYEHYYGLSDPCFLDYLATLGLKGPNGETKPAWTALADEAGKRGW